MVQCSMTDSNTEIVVEAEIIDLSTWQQRFNELANEQDIDAPAIRLPRKNGKRVNRADIEAAFVNAFEMVGGVPRLALYADANYGEFIKIFGRLLPKESLQVHDGEIRLVHAIAPSKLDE